MANIIQVGKHYINIDEISHIQCVELEFGVKCDSKYEFAFKNGGYLKVTGEEFNEFKKRECK